jgi:thiol:disulfide interchange protein DsbD
VRAQQAEPLINGNHTLEAHLHHIFIDFTADWCVTCKINERTSLTSASVKAAIEGSNAVYLVGDWTRRDDAITAELLRHGRSGVPLYLLYAPGVAEPRVLPQLLTEGVVVEALRDLRRQN